MVGIVALFDVVVRDSNFANRSWKKALEGSTIFLPRPLQAVEFEAKTQKSDNLNAGPRGR